MSEESGFLLRKHWAVLPASPLIQPRAAGGTLTQSDFVLVSTVQAILWSLMQ